MATDPTLIARLDKHARDVLLEGTDAGWQVAKDLREAMDELRRYQELKVGWHRASVSLRAGSPEPTPEEDREEAAATRAWQPIETAPKDGRYLLLASPACGRVIGAHIGGDVWHFIGTGAVTGASERATHWMPLPAAPSVTGTALGGEAPLAPKDPSA